MKAGADGKQSLGPPRVWIVRSWRVGENSQILGLAEALQRRLGWHYESKTVVYRRIGAVFDLLRWTTRLGINARKSDPLVAPWPDLIISAGLRNESICRWIKDRAGGATKLVFVGRTWRGPRDIDLLITTPQYRVPKHPGVLENLLPLHSVTQANLDAVAGPIQFTGLQPPLTTVLVGGSSGPYVLGQRAAAALAADLNQLDGSLLISGSARTPPGFLRVLESSLQRPYRIYRFRPGDPDNPYFAWLAGSERICVTADSISLLSEAIATGKPVTVFDPLRHTRDIRLRALGYQWMMRNAPRRLTRDVAIVHERLLAEGRITWLEDAIQGDWSRNNERGVDNTWAAIDRVQALLTGNEPIRGV